MNREEVCRHCGKGGAYGSEYSYWRTAEEALKFALRQAKKAREKRH